MHKDNLFKLIDTQLKEATNTRETTNDFVRKIVNIYVLQLLNQGNIPMEFQEEVMADVEAEVIEIYRKKTYGFLTLEEYRRHTYRQKNDN